MASKAKDPRRKTLVPKRGRAPTANEQLLDAALRHAHWFERLKAGEANQVLAFLNDQVIPDLQDRIAGRIQRAADAGFDTGAATRARLEALHVAITAVIIEASRALRDRLIENIIEIGRYEAEFEAAALQRAVPQPVIAALEVSFDLPSAAQMRDIVRATPFQGDTLKGWTEKLGADAVGRIEREIKIGLVNGESASEITRRVFGSRAASFEDGAVALLRRDADALTRTAIASIQHAGRDAFQAANPDVYTSTEYWFATLDAITCTQCQPLDGKTDPPQRLPAAPLHPRCRCLKRRQIRPWDELGLTPDDFDDLDSGGAARLRTSLSGPVSAKIDYGEWISNQSARVQDRALGPKRAALLRSGEVEYREFFDDRGRLLTLAELRATDSEMES